MKRALQGTILCLLVLIVTAGFLAAEENKVRVIVKKANIRLKPAPSSLIIGQASQRTILTVVGKFGDWYRVNFSTDESGEKKSGYIHRSVVRIVVPEDQKKPGLSDRLRVTPPVQPADYSSGSLTNNQVKGMGITVGYAGSGLLFGGQFTYGVTKYFALKISGQMYRSDEEGDPEKLSRGRLTVIPIQFSFQGRFPQSEQLVPYLEAGAGYYLNIYDLDSEIVTAWETLGFDIREKVNNSIGYHFGTGVDFLVRTNLGFNAELKYCILRPKGTWTITDQASQTFVNGDIADLDFSTLMFAFGMKYYF
jgi:outer membrane protein